MSTKPSTTLLVTEQYSNAHWVYGVMSSHVVQHIISCMEHRREVTTRELITPAFKQHTILKFLRRMESIYLVRRERLGSEVTYTLNHVRLEAIRAAAGSIGELAGH